MALSENDIAPDFELPDQDSKIAKVYLAVKPDVHADEVLRDYEKLAR